jgi:hypothetical protein
VLGAIYGLIQASLKYFIKSAEVLKGIGFEQCPFDMALFFKWFPNGRVSLFWQHVDDRWGGFSTDEDMQDTLQRLHEQLGSQQESTAMVLGHDNEYDRLKGVMRWSCKTKIHAFMASEQMTNITLRSTPLTKDMAAQLTHANCPDTQEGRDLMISQGKTKAYRKYVGFFSYSVQIVHVECKNIARLFSRFMQNPGELHYQGIIYALGYLLFSADDYMEYRRPDGFDGTFHLIIMVDADLGSDHSKGKNSSSTMAGVAFLENNHCYSYSKSIKAIVMSTFHSEMYALVEGAQMAIYLARLLRSMKFAVKFPVAVVGDNESTLAAASVPQTKQGRHLNLRAHWLRDVQTLSDLILAHLKGTLNAANVLSKVDTAVNFKREKEWLKRGIHDPAYQAQIKPTMDKLAQRAFTWERSLQQRNEKRLREEAKKTLPQTKAKL